MDVTLPLRKPMRKAYLPVKKKDIRLLLRKMVVYFGLFKNNKRIETA